MRANNFRLVAVGGLADVIQQVRLWHDGVRFPGASDARPHEPDDAEARAWDAWIHSRDEMHRGDQKCACWRCRPNRKYK
jgi:hypothetical protein